MSLRTLALLMTTGTLVALPAAAEAAGAAPPVNAKITFGVGMAGARLNQVTTEVTGAGTLGPAPFNGWGRLEGGFCFEATACTWSVPGGGRVFIDRTGGATHRTVSVGTSAPGWTTSKGVGPGTSVAILRARYPGLVKLTTCDLGGFGAPSKGYRLGKHVFFRTTTARVSAVFVTRQTIRGGGCA